jgi:hypothetical protein
MRPMTMNAKPKPVMWLDAASGKGVTLDGRTLSTVIKSRHKTPQLDDVLDTAAHAGIEWIMLTGAEPKTPKDLPSWMDTPTPGWKHGEHYRRDDKRGRYEKILTGQKVEISMASTWFGDVVLSPAQASDAWGALRYYLNRVEPEMITPLMSPGLTGAILWAFSVTERKGQRFDPEPISERIAELLHSTSGQHHMEHLVAGPNASEHPDTVALVDPKATPTLDTFAHSDGRFMYAAHCAELGVGPAHELTREEATDLWMFQGPKGKYAKARYRVKFQVPDNWPHVGILGVQDQGSSTDWYYPNRPGAVGETWADHRELLVAERFGWGIEPLGGIRFTEKMRPLDTFAERIKRLRAQVAESEAPAGLKRAVMNALRNILIHGIGRFVMRGKESPLSVDHLDDLPPNVEYEHVGDRFVYSARPELSAADKSRYHPELASQVWGWSRAQVLSAPSPIPGIQGRYAGALHVDPRTLLGIEGDAIYTSSIPQWSLPTEHGGGDDGREGRVRLQGLLRGDIKTPVTKQERDALKKKALSAGPSAAWET